MTNEWSAPVWYVIYGADRCISVLVMVRAALISREAISIAHYIYISGRIAIVPPSRHICHLLTCMELRRERLAIIE